MKRIAFIFIFLLPFIDLNAQVIHSATIEVVGSPSWYKTINLKNEGLVLVLKEDRTRFKVARFDVALNKIWELELFFDTESGPAATRLYKDRLALIFSETSGMYYQIIDFDLKTGETKRTGFEVREFFQDRDLLMFDDRALLVGTNDSGAVFYSYHFPDESGGIVPTDLKGHISVEKAFLDESGLINILGTEKDLGYSNEKKKKGEYVKSSAVFVARLDSEGKLLSKKNIVQNEGKFPITVSASEDASVATGLYQEPGGNKGLYFSFFNKPENKPVFFVPLENFLNPQLTAKEKKRFLDASNFFVFPVKSNPNEITIGGIFYTPKYQNYSSNAGYDPYTGRRRTESRSVFVGLEFSTAYIYKLDRAGNKVFENHIPINQITTQLASPVTLNDAGAVAYVSQGKLLVRNFDIGTRPIVYQLTDDNAGNNPYVASYNHVDHWYDNVFLAIGSQSKIEAQQVEAPVDKTKKKKKKAPEPFTQTKKTYFLTAISAGRIG